MKRFLTLALSSVLLLSVTACSTQNENTTQNESTANQETAVSVGETFTISDWDITVNDFEFTEIFQDDTQEITAGDRDKFVLLSVSATNHGTEGAVFLPTSAKEGQIHSRILHDGHSEYMASTLVSPMDMHDKVLEPETPTEGILAFTLPIELFDEDDKPLTLQFFDTDTTVSLNLR